MNVFKSTPGFLAMTIPLYDKSGIQQAIVTQLAIEDKIGLLLVMVGYG